jgi:hypothetical protein
MKNFFACIAQNKLTFENHFHSFLLIAHNHVIFLFVNLVTLNLRKRQFLKIKNTLTDFLKRKLIFKIQNFCL